MNTEFKDYYKILGITPRASFENIRSAAERELGQNWNNAIGRLEVQEAYEVLSNPERRKEYDLEFNRRLTERENAIRNARTFEEYIAATSLHSELANIDSAPEVEVPQEEIEQSEVNNQNSENTSQTSETAEEKEQEESTIDSFVSGDSSEPTTQNIEISQGNEEDAQEDVEEAEQEDEIDQEQEEQIEQKMEEKIEEEQQNQQLEEEQMQVQEQFLSIPVQRLEKEQYQNKPIKQDREAIKEEPIISKLALKEIIRAAIIAGGVGVGALVIGGVPGVVIGLMAGVATGDFFKKHAKLERKPNFQKESKLLQIKEVNTEETKFFNEYAKNLENQIYDLLDKPNKNYELEIAIRKYANLVELTEKRIHFKSSEAEKNYTILKKLEIIALKNKKDRLENTLKQLQSKMKMQPYQKDLRLSGINRELSYISHEIINIENDQEITKGKQEEIIDDLNIEKARLVKKRDKSANRLYVNKDIISFGQVALVKIDSTMSIVRSSLNRYLNFDEHQRLDTNIRTR